MSQRKLEPYDFSTWMEREFNSLQAKQRIERQKLSDESMAAEGEDRVEARRRYDAAVERHKSETIRLQEKFYVQRWLITAAQVAAFVIVLGFVFTGVAKCARDQPQREPPHAARPVQKGECVVYEIPGQETSGVHHITVCGDTITSTYDWKTYCGKACWANKHDENHLARNRAVRSATAR